MKNIVIAVLICVFCFSVADAQTIKLYKDNTLVATYKSSEVNRIVFEKEEETPVTPVTPDTGDHEYVDLGLTSGTLWAKTNIGAETETDYGLYFAWGETTGYTSDTSDGHSFDWANYKWMTSGQSSREYCTKYTIADGQTDGCWYSNGTYVGTTVDGTTYTNLTELEAADDAATANWGSNWCMPTHAQMKELVNGTDCSWTTIDGVSGYKFANKSDASKYVFLPAAGYRYYGDLRYVGFDGYYWSRSLSSDDSNNAYDLYFDLSYIDWGYIDRYCGRSIRAVRVQN